MYTIVYKKKAGYCSQSFSTSHIDRTKLLNMLYWFYQVTVIKNNNIVFTYKAE